MKPRARSGALAAVALVLAACAPAPTAPALRTIDAQGLQGVVEAAAAQLGVPGAMVLLRTPQGEFTAAYGTTELGAQTPPTADTHFRIASNTKTMTAALIVLLAQGGKLELDDPVSAFVSDVPDGENMTVAQLLGQEYGYGISYQRFGPNAAMFYHGGEIPGFNSFMGYDAENDVGLVIWTNLTLSPEGDTTAQAMLPILLDEIYAGLSLVPGE